LKFWIVVVPEGDPGRAELPNTLKCVTIAVYETNGQYTKGIW